jgi:ADP-heptose:LPS heptosyltransferase
MTADKVIVDCVVSCCNPAIKSVLSSWVTENGNPVLRDIFYRDLFFDNAEMVQNFKDNGYLLLDEISGRDNLFEISGIEEAEQYGYFRKHFYRHKFLLTYQEQVFFDSMPEKYIILHPSGGTQAVDGLTRQEYQGLILKLLDAFPEYHFITIGADHRRDFGNEIDCSGCDNWVNEMDNITCLKDNSRVCARLKETPFSIDHERFIDLTNKTSGALCANIVEKASGFIGSHSAWMNFFWHFNKPTVCVLSNKTDWGDAENYVLTNGCRWGFSLPQTAVVPVDPNTETQRHGEDKRKAILYEVYNQVIMELRWKIANGNL